jgi:hypothetical protein
VLAEVLAEHLEDLFLLPQEPPELRPPPLHVLGPAAVLHLAHEAAETEDTLIGHAPHSWSSLPATCDKLLALSIDNCHCVCRWMHFGHTCVLYNIFLFLNYYHH